MPDLTLLGGRPSRLGVPGVRMARLPAAPVVAEQLAVAAEQLAVVAARVAAEQLAVVAARVAAEQLAAESPRRER